MAKCLQEITVLSQQLRDLQRECAEATAAAAAALDKHAAHSADTGHSARGSEFLSCAVDQLVSLLQVPLPDPCKVLLVRPEHLEDMSQFHAFDSVYGALLDKCCDSGCLQEKQAAVKRLEAAAKVAAEERVAAAAQPLECSQRAVVRDLSARFSALTRESVQLKSERDVALVNTLPNNCTTPATTDPLFASVLHSTTPRERQRCTMRSAVVLQHRKDVERLLCAAQERLRTLRASLGSHRSPGAPEEPAAALLSLPARAARAAESPQMRGASAGAPTAAPLPAVAVELESLSGLCTMLGQHLDTLEAAQQPLTAALQAYDDFGAAEKSKGDSEGHALSAAVQQALGQAMLEVGAMRSTLHVLSGSLPLLRPQAPSTDGGPAAIATGPPAKDGVASVSQPTPGAEPVGGKSDRNLPLPKGSVSQAAAEAAATAVAELKAKAEKWKMRCRELKREMAAAAAAAGGREAAAAERLAAAEASLQQALHQGPPVRRAGDRPAEPARPQLTVQLQEAQAEARAAAARAAERDARLKAAQKQLETVRAGASAAQAALQEEIQSLKVSYLTHLFTYTFFS